MRPTILLFFLAFSSVVAARTYYFAPKGNDVVAGTIDAPLTTWGKAFTTAIAGDTVFFRGGIYMKSDRAAYLMYTSGTTLNPIVFLNYPGEVPILDCDGVVGVRSTQTGIIVYANYAVFKGIVFTPHLDGISAADALELNTILKYT